MTDQLPLDQSKHVMDNKIKLYKKILEAKKNISSITKNKRNEFAKYSYADISAINDEIEPALHEVGLFVMAFSDRSDIDIMEIRIIDAETGSFVYTHETLRECKTMQNQGSAETYARKYGIRNLLNLSCEDDDGQSLQHQLAKQSYQAKPAPLKQVTAPLKPLAAPKLETASFHADIPLENTERDFKDYVYELQHLFTLYELDIIKANEKRGAQIKEALANGCEGKEIENIKSIIEWIKSLKKETISNG